MTKRDSKNSKHLKLYQYCFLNTVVTKNSSIGKINKQKNYEKIINHASKQPIHQRKKSGRKSKTTLRQMKMKTQ